MYDPSFNRVGSFSNPYLKHCHEIDVDGDSLYVTSTGCYSVLRYDLSDRRFVDGFLVRFQGLQRTWTKALRRTGGRRLGDLIPPKPALRWFDPNQPHGPLPFDTCHLNSVTATAGRVFVAGRRLRGLHEIDDGRLSIYATVPPDTHNTRPFRDGVLMNDTDADAVRYTSRDGDTRLSVPVASYPEAEVQNLHLAVGRARQAFGRGLTVHADRYLIAGSSPATVSVFDLEERRLIKTVNLTMDVRNAVHGLEIWPFAPPHQPSEAIRSE